MPIPQVDPGFSASYFFFFNCMKIFASASLLSQLVLLNIQYQSSIFSHQMSGALMQKSDECFFSAGLMSSD